MALIRNGRNVFQSPGKNLGIYTHQSGNFVKGGLRNRFLGGFDQKFGGYPNGHLYPSSFVLPQKSGSISTYTLSTGEISGNSSLTPARNLVGSANISITITNAQLDQIVSAVANATGGISVTSAALAAAAGISANANGTITITASQLGAIFSVLASSSCVASGTGSNLTAKAFMSADAGGPPELSPEALANAVLDALLIDHNTAGTVGEALNSIGASGNPWSSDLSTNNSPGTFGERVQKILTKTQFLGLK